MKSVMRTLTALLLAAVLACGCAGAIAEGEETEPMYELTQGYGFKLGAPLSFNQLRDAKYLNVLKSHFNSLTATNEMKAYSLLDERASRRAADGMPVMNYTMADKMVGWAQENGIGVRGHVLVWDAYMCDWYFHEGYDPAKPYADPETVRQRTEYYITQVVTHFEEKFPGVVYCWDVVNEAVGDSAGEYAPGDPRHLRTVRSGAPNLFREYMGEDYVAQAFLYARNAAEALGADIKLYYNDYNAFYPDKAKAILALVRSVDSYAQDADGQPRRLVDGVGMQGYIGGYGVQDGCLDDSLLKLIDSAIRNYAAAGYEVQITEMAVRNFDLAQAERHAEYYADLFRVLMAVNTAENAPLKAVSIWGLTDTNAPKGNYVYNLNSPYGGLLDLKLQYKDAFFRVRDALRQGL